MPPKKLPVGKHESKGPDVDLTRSSPYSSHLSIEHSYSGKTTRKVQGRRISLQAALCHAPSQQYDDERL
ncbi:hypothetical protein J1614_002762 [Plenodomus biglobosus]|nr:hypothetical protein J1614_002762 [Plenodomus biglobosus]